ncbi:rRNA methyltransferase [Raphidocelis subcapitata]|uniref:rRNA methyltransferase n=1 Tax=Raphidocelis subcapitata TaxID=307507 RepID=A0A2V0PFQ8_9CHLO|nr:rRNA methyltransferase [Raphidocelis subcapitata]|eukprot:GBF98626.1 rRNA methyltransferase [Raphidocelis subcapitata]
MRGPQAQPQLHRAAPAAAESCRRRHRRRRCCCSTTASSAAATAPAGAAADAPAAPTQPLLADLRVVLVAPKTPGNVGAVARACANFEALDLVVVAPRCDPLDGEAWKVACGDRVLSRLRVVDSLPEALADCTGSVGFTRRAGCTRLTHASIGAMLRDYPDAVPGMAPCRQGEASQQQQQWGQESGADGDHDLWASIAAQGRTALVYGREESGLTEDELRLCTHACAIPTGRVQPSMNLSHAVGVTLAALFERRLAAAGLEELPMGQDVQGNPRVQAGLQPAAASELEALLAKVAALARAVGVSDLESHGGGNQGNHGRRRLPLGHVRAILSRAKANTWEVRSLHGLAAAALKALGAEEPARADNSKGGGGGGSGGDGPV